MYNQYLSQMPVDVTPEPVPEERAAQAVSCSESGGGLFSLLSNALGQKSALNDLLSSENLVVLAALVFLAYNGEKLDTELIALAVLFLIIGL